MGSPSWKWDQSNSTPDGIDSKYKYIKEYAFSSSFSSYVKFHFKYTDFSLIFLTTSWIVPKTSGFET